MTARSNTFEVYTDNMKNFKENYYVASPSLRLHMPSRVIVFTPHHQSFLTDSQSSNANIIFLVAVGTCDILFQKRITHSSRALLNSFDKKKSQRYLPNAKSFNNFGLQCYKKKGLLFYRPLQKENEIPNKCIDAHVI